MAALDNKVFDEGLSVISDDGNKFVVCSQEPTTFTEADVTYALGNKTTPTIAAPSDRTGGGREVILSSFTDGTVTATGTATHYAILDTVNSLLLATQSLTASQALTSGNDLQLTADVSIAIPDPA